MAKKSVEARQRKREKMIAKYAQARQKYKKEGNYEALDKLPKNASPVRSRNRCKITSRGRGITSKKYGISRNLFRKMASEGKIPGVRKASW